MRGDPVNLSDPTGLMPAENAPSYYFDGVYWPGLRFTGNAWLSWGTQRGAVKPSQPVAPTANGTASAPAEQSQEDTQAGLQIDPSKYHLLDLQLSLTGQPTQFVYNEVDFRRDLLTLSDAFVGFGEGISFGASQSLLEMTPGAAEVDRASFAYRLNFAFGQGLGVATGVGAFRGLWARLLALRATPLAAGATSAALHPALKLPGATNTINHIFGRSAHGLDGLVTHFGSRQAAYTALYDATQAVVRAQGTTGVFQSTVTVAGQSVAVRGNVIDGILRLSTAFVP